MGMLYSAGDKSHEAGSNTMKLSNFAKYSWFVLGWNLLVILWGALVRATGSGAGCGNHWPTCNGELIPTPERIQTTIEFTHRALSGGDLILIFVMVIWGWRIFKKGSPVRIGLVGSGVFIIVEALLGAGLVLFDFVGQTSSVARALAVGVHLLNTFVLLAFVALTAWWASGGKAISFKGQRKWVLLLGAGILGICLIGMTGAITALGDTLFPAKTLAQGLAQDTEAGVSFLIRLRVIHPLIGIVVGTYTFYLIGYLRKQFEDKAVRRLSLILGGVILLQWAAGVTNLLLLAPIWMQLIHLFIADSVWISYILLAANVFAIRPQT